jgi:hypothetical protein
VDYYSLAPAIRRRVSHLTKVTLYQAELPRQLDEQSNQ